MNSDHRDVYIMRGEDGVSEGEAAWLAPRPAEEVILEEVVEGSDLTREDVEPVSDRIDYSALHALLAGEEDADDVVFTVEGWTVTVMADGTVTVERTD